MQYRVKNNNVFQGVIDKQFNNTFEFIEWAGNFAKNRFDSMFYTYRFDSENLSIWYLKKGDKKYNFLDFDKIN